MRRYLRPPLGSKRLAKLGAADMHTMLDGLRADGHKPRSVPHVLATVRAALSTAMRWG